MSDKAASSIVQRQRQIDGVIYFEAETLGLRMLNWDGEVAAEVWVTPANVADVIQWLQYARNCLESARREGQKK